MKRDRQRLSDQAIAEFLSGYTSGAIPDYQMAALLMAIFCNGLNDQETLALTRVMLESGKQVAFSDDFFPVDKHSTGGIGDKASLILAPLVAACGVPVPMMSGRGLGHTGGTLDKLESIPGFNVTLSLPEFKSQVEKFGLAFIGQTNDICPADKKIYALRDVTGTVESLPLICASILSKKIAEGIRGLVLDVKSGSGAFMKSFSDAQALAEKLLGIARGYGLKAKALITNMDQPLGRFVGNGLEVHETLSLLRQRPSLGKGPGEFMDTLELSIELASQMVAIGKKLSSEAARTEVERALSNGSAYEIFERVCAKQGGRLKELSEPAPADYLRAEKPGYVHFVNCEEIGLAGIELGAGRRQAEDRVDHSSGFYFLKKEGDEVDKGEPLIAIYGQQNLGAVKNRLLKSFVIQEIPEPASPLFLTNWL